MKFALALLLCTLHFSANAQATPVFGVKTGLAYLYALSDVTQVPITDPLIANLYGRVKSRLPITGEFTELSEPVLFGMVSLGAQFCRRWVDAEILKPNIYSRMVTKGISFSRAPKAVSEEIRLQMLRDFGLGFWGRVPSEAEMKVLSAYLTASADLLPETGKATQDWVVTTCAQYATSLEFLLN